MAHSGTDASCNTGLRQATSRVCGDMGRSGATSFSRMACVDALLNALLDSALVGGDGCGLFA